MIYVVKKFRHYFLAKESVFFVDHQELMYLVNKPFATRRIVWWFVILLEFDFTVAIKKGSTYYRADHISIIMTGESPTRVDDDLPNAALFSIEIAPHWAQTIITFSFYGNYFK